MEKQKLLCKMTLLCKKIIRNSNTLGVHQQLPLTLTSSFDSEKTFDNVWSKQGWSLYSLMYIDMGKEHYKVRAEEYDMKRNEKRAEKKLSDKDYHEKGRIRTQNVRYRSDELNYIKIT